MMIFTSGTSGEPKAVQVAHLMVLFAGVGAGQRFELTADDVCYLSMPLFHSNALLAGWSVAVGVRRGDGARRRSRRRVCCTICAATAPPT